jgi:hypothetical protein
LDRPKEKRIVVHRTAATWLVVRETRSGVFAALTLARRAKHAPAVAAAGASLRGKAQAPT